MFSGKQRVDVMQRRAFGAGLARLHVVAEQSLSAAKPQTVGVYGNGTNVASNCLRQLVVAPLAYVVDKQSTLGSHIENVVAHKNGVHTCVDRSFVGISVVRNCAVAIVGIQSVLGAKPQHSLLVLRYGAHG